MKTTVRTAHRDAGPPSAGQVHGADGHAGPTSLTASGPHPQTRPRPVQSNIRLRGAAVQHDTTGELFAALMLAIAALAAGIGAAAVVAGRLGPLSDRLDAAAVPAAYAVAAGAVILAPLAALARYDHRRHHTRTRRH